MSLYNDLTTVLTPYANKIKQNESDIGDIQDALDHLDVETDKTLSVDGKPADAEAVGDKLADLKEELTAFDGINHINVVSQDGKKFITPSGAITSASGNYHVSNPISVSAGDEVRFTCRVAGANIIPIALCDSNGENIIPVVAGVSGDVLHEYIYDVQEDEYIILSYRFDSDYNLIILDGLSNVSLKQVAEANRKTIEEQCGVTNVDFAFINGKKYITANGNIESSIVNSHVSKPIQVHTGDKIEFIASSIPQTTVIALCDADSTNVIPKVIAEDNSEHIYSLEIETDGYVIVSYLCDNSADLYLLKDYASKRLKEAIGDLVVESENLINHRTMIDNTAVANNGTLVSNVQYATTEKIPVKPSTTYSYRNIYRVVFYNANNVRIGAYVTNKRLNTGNFTTPANTAYIRLCVLKYNSQVGKIYDTTQWQLVEGTSLPDYEQQKIVVDGYRIADTTAITHDKVTAFRRWDKICFDKEPVVFAETESEATTKEDRTTSGIIAHYDALMAANSDYITKTALGTASDGTTTIYQYDFNTPGAKVVSGSRDISTNEKTKIILISGVHPEFGGIYGLFNAMREITNNPNLRDIKNGVHFIIIPTVNPYGIDTKNRKNANGIDLARNFEVDYAPGTDSSSNTYSGTAALSEPESIIVDSVLSANTDAIIFASCHSFQLSSDNNVIWGSCATMYTTNIVAKLVTKMSEAWRQKYTSIIPQKITTILGQSGISTEAGSEGKQATKYGIQGLTLETSDYFPYDDIQNAHTAFAMSRNSETYINFIKTALGLWESSDPKDLSLIGLH